ncbi:MAG: HlyD family efflux transporter periplasmic adaptor subunit, partial [Gammaproteobacteria bacterium]|nr:HlyD family efflux transporter periplasmic adaptor subunit [Gammaproteobacteria bacterium]
RKILENEKQLLQLQERAIKRLESLNNKQLVSDAEVDAAKASKIKQELNITQRQLLIDSYTKQLARLKTELHRYELAQQQLSEELANCQVVSPYAGRVEKLYATDGEYLNAGDPILTAYNLTDIKVKAAISATDVPTLRQTLTKKLPLKALSMVDEQLFNLDLEKLSRGDMPSGIFKFTHGAEQFSLGQHVELCLSLPPVKAFAVPQTAIYEHQRIYLVKDGHAKAITIKPIGHIYNLKNPERAQVLVQSNLLEDGDILITSHLDNIYTGLEVESALK